MLLFKNPIRFISQVGNAPKTLWPFVLGVLGHRMLPLPLPESTVKATDVWECIKAGGERFILPFKLNVLRMPGTIKKVTCFKVSSFLP